jgi:gentisate 1,2-dioxygenase
MIVEGEGAYTTVDGEKCNMHRGDLILTPSGLWHEHGHDGTQPVVWLDVLDLPLVHYMETSYVLEGKAQTVTSDATAMAYQRGGVVPAPLFARSECPTPMLRYAWTDVRAALQTLARTQPEMEAVQVAYINPETGADCQKILGFSALMLRPGETLALPVRSSATVFHVIEGAAGVTTAEHALQLQEADTCCVPGYTATLLRNHSSATPAFVFMADDAPLQKKLGLYEVCAA